MWALALPVLLNLIARSVSDEEPTFYYYGLEESERGLRACGARAACAVRLRRAWRPAASVRLCACGRRRRCPHATDTTHSAIELNNWAEFKFCQPVTDWRQCSTNETALRVQPPLPRLDPDEIEDLHRRNVHLRPPNITFACRCPEPNHWRLRASYANHTEFQCSGLPLCGTGELCGHYRLDPSSLYQSCLCPRRHMCVHRGGVTYVNITELLYEGPGREAFCERLGPDYDDYNDY